MWVCLGINAWKYISTSDAAAKIAENFASVPDGEYKLWIMLCGSIQRQSVLTQRQSEFCVLTDNPDSGLHVSTAKKSNCHRKIILTLFRKFERKKKTLWNNPNHLKQNSSFVYLFGGTNLWCSPGGCIGLHNWSNYLWAVSLKQGKKQHHPF